MIYRENRRISSSMAGDPAAVVRFSEWLPSADLLSAFPLSFPAHSPNFAVLVQKVSLAAPKCPVAVRPKEIHDAC
jgi:hypothetical protein